MNKDLYSRNNRKHQGDKLAKNDIIQLVPGSMTWRDSLGCHCNNANGRVRNMMAENKVNPERLDIEA